MSFRNHVQFTFFFQYTPEVYPTTLRSIGVGSCSSMARFGAMLTPYIAQVLLQQSFRNKIDKNKTRSYKDECSTGSNNHLRLTDLLRSEIIEVNRSKDLDDTAPPPSLPHPSPLFDLSCSSIGGLSLSLRVPSVLIKMNNDKTIAQVLLRQSFQGAIAVYSTTTLLATVCCLLLPIETKDREMGGSKG